MWCPEDCTHVKTDLLKKTKEALQYEGKRVANAVNVPIKIS